MPFHEYTLKVRKFRSLHPDRIAHRSLPFEVFPWTQLTTPHEFLSDVRDQDTGDTVGIIVRPDNYSDRFGKDLYYGSLLERKPGEDDDLFVAAEWCTDFEQEVTNNTDAEGNTNTDTRRLMCLAFNLYNPSEKERVERNLHQQRLGIQQRPWFLPFKLLKYALRRSDEPREELGQLGSYYNLDFKLDGENLVLDENVIPGRAKSWGSKYYELKTSSGDTVARIHRKPGILGLSALHITNEYSIEIDRKHDDNKSLLYLCVALADYLHMEDRIRENCFYEGKDTGNLPGLSMLFRYD